MNQQEPSNMDWLGWRQVNEHFKVDAAMFCQGECLLPNLLGKFYDQQQHCDVTFQLQDGSTVQASTNIYHKLWHQLDNLRNRHTSCFLLWHLQFSRECSSVRWLTKG